MWTKFRRFRGGFYCLLVLYSLTITGWQRHLEAQSSMGDMERRVARMEDQNVDVRLARIEAQMEDLRRNSDRSYNLNLVLLTCIVPLLLEMGLRMISARAAQRK